MSLESILEKKRKIDVLQGSLLSKCHPLWPNDLNGISPEVPTSFPSLLSLPDPGRSHDVVKGLREVDLSRKTCEW